VGRKGAAALVEDSSKRFTNLATLTPAANELGAFSDDESEANTTVTTASSAGPDHRTLRAQKRKESQHNTAAVDTKANPVVRGKSPANTPADKGSSGSNIAVQKANVRVVFEKYCEEDNSGEDVITPQGLQELCLDYGTYLSLDDVLIAMKDVDKNFDGVFQYEEFMVWWRNNPFGCVFLLINIFLTMILLLWSLLYGFRCICVLCSVQ
jgi:hypothetical protein